MAVLTPRQETAQRLARELQSFGATVTNVMPLDDSQNLRFWCSDYEKKELLQQLKDAGHEVVFLGMQPQVFEQQYLARPQRIDALLYLNAHAIRSKENAVVFYLSPAKSSSAVVACPHRLVAARSSSGSST